MGTGTDVLTKIDTPQFGAIQLIAVYHHVTCPFIRPCVSMTVILGVAWIPFYKQLILAIAVHITYTAVVGRVAIFEILDVGGIGRTVELDALVIVAPGCDDSRGIYGYAVHLSHHLDFVGGRAGK